MTFVLLGRDAAAPAAIRAWIAERIRLGKNRPDDSQIAEAEDCAWIMERERVKPEGQDTSSVLLEACKDVLVFLERELDGLKSCEAERRILRSAIAKAKGRHS